MNKISVPHWYFSFNIYLKIKSYGDTMRGGKETQNVYWEQKLYVEIVSKPKRGQIKYLLTSQSQNKSMIVLNCWVVYNMSNQIGVKNPIEQLKYCYSVQKIKINKTEMGWGCLIR